MNRNDNRPISRSDRRPISRSDRRLWKLVGNKKLMIKGRNKKSIEAELEFYQTKGGKTKSVRNRITRLEEAMAAVEMKDE